jgi:uncharacterized protein YdeI (YjbR/CyaY-like superfamily)
LSNAICYYQTFTYKTPQLFDQYCSIFTMSTKVQSQDLPTYSFSSATDFEAFLDREYATAPGFYLKLAKKASGISSLSAAEAVEVALCFGWIDGRANKVDDDWWTVRYTPRRSKSIWSQKNVTTIGRLIEEGRMRPAGLATVEAAKADGRWDRAYAGPATIIVPDDLVTALAADPAAAAHFAGMNKSDRYAVLWRVETASVQNRSNRIAALVQTLAAGKRPGTVPKSTGKSKKSAGGQKTTARTAVVKNKKKIPLSGTLESAQTVQDAQTRKPRREGLRGRFP